jgi:hypothetical protein
LIGHPPRKGDESMEKRALDWNPHGARRRGKPKQTWKRTVLEEAGKWGQTWREVKRLAGNRVRRRFFINALCS